MTPHAQPVIRSLQRKVYVLAGLQLENRQPPVARYRQHVENSVFAPAVGKDLRIYKTLIERSIDPRNVLAHQRLQPALRLCAIQRLARIACQRMTIGLQLMD